MWWWPLLVVAAEESPVGRALMLLEQSQDQLDEVDIESLLKVLLPSREHYLAKVDDYVRPTAPYVFDAVTPELLDDWPATEVADIFARFDSDSNGKIEEGEVQVEASDDSIFRRFAAYFYSTPRTDMRRMWSVLKNLTCSCVETDGDTDNVVRAVYAPCLIDAQLRALDGEAPSGFCRLQDDPTSMTAVEFHDAARRVLFQMGPTSSKNITFSMFRKFVLEQPAEITAAISRLVRAGAYPEARALLLQQLLLATQLDEDDESFALNDARYRLFLRDRDNAELIEVVFRWLGALLVLFIFTVLCLQLGKLRTDLKRHQVALAYFEGVAKLDRDYDDPLFAAAIQTGHADALKRDKNNFPHVADASLASLDLLRLDADYDEAYDVDDGLLLDKRPLSPSSACRRRLITSPPST